MTKQDFNQIDNTLYLEGLREGDLGYLHYHNLRKVLKELYEAKSKPYKKSPRDTVSRMFSSLG